MDRAGIKTVGQLITHSPSELIKIHSFGPKSPVELEKILIMLGFDFKKEEIC